MMFIYYTKEGKFKFNYLYWDNIPFSNLHREDGPAITTPLKKEWRQNGKLHRIDGPAVIYPNPSNRKEWWVDGKLHRLDGPAIIGSSGKKEWYVNGKILNKNEVETWINENNINLKTKEHQALFMLMFG